MFPKILTQIFGSRNDRLLKTYRRTVQLINSLEPQFEKLDDAQLRAKGVDAFKSELAAKREAVRRARIEARLAAQAQPQEAA